MLEPLSISLGLIIGGGLGTIAGGLFAAGRAKEEIDALELRAAADDQLLRKQGRELAEHRADKQRRMARRARAKAGQRAITDRCHAEMRELVGEVI